MKKRQLKKRLRRNGLNFSIKNIGVTELLQIKTSKRDIQKKRSSKNNRNNVASRLRRKGLITSITGISTEELLRIEKQHNSNKPKNIKTKTPKPVQNRAPKRDRTRENIARRLRRRGLVFNIRDLTTEELFNMWLDLGDKIPVEERTTVDEQNEQELIAPILSNYEQLMKILSNMVEDYKEVFVGTFRNAWMYLPEIEYFHTRIDPEKVNSDKNFIPTEIPVITVPPSDWWVGDQHNMLPEEVAEHLRAKFEKYLY